MQAFHVKKGDEVVLIAGADKGKRGRIIGVLRRKGRVVVEGVKLVKRHQRKSQQHPQGAVVEREGSVHASNVMKLQEYESRVARRPVKSDLGKQS
jgi:large subunit ribosomal protein L24